MNFPQGIPFIGRAQALVCLLLLLSPAAITRLGAQEAAGESTGSPQETGADGAAVVDSSEVPAADTSSPDADLESPGEFDLMPGIEEVRGEGLLPADGGQELVPSQNASAGVIAEEDAILDAEETIVPEAIEIPTPAGDGYLGFYEFGQVPAYLRRVGLLNVPSSGGVLVNRPGSIHRIGPLRYGGSLTGGVAYSDNIFGSAENRQGDAIWSLTPVLFLEVGNQANFRVLYSPSLQQYTRFTSQSAVNQTLLLSFDIPFTKLSTGGSFAYTTREGVFSDSDGYASQSTVGGNIFASYLLGHRTTLRLSYDFSIQESSPGGQLFDNSLESSISYRLGPRAQVQAFITPGFSVGAERQTYITAGFGGSYKVSTRLEAFGKLGVEVRGLSDSGNDILVSPVLEGGVAWNPTDWLTLRGGAFRDIRNDSFETSQTNINTGGSLGASVILWRRLTVGIDGVLAYTEQLSDTGDADERYLYGSLNAFASYPVLQTMSVNAFYTYSVRGGASGISGYDQNTYGISLTWTF